MYSVADYFRSSISPDHSQCEEIKSSPDRLWEQQSIVIGRLIEFKSSGDVEPNHSGISNMRSGIVGNWSVGAGALMCFLSDNKTEDFYAEEKERVHFGRFLVFKIRMNDLFYPLF